MLTFGISLPEEDIDLSKLYWIPKLHKNPYKQRYIAGSAKSSTKPLSQILTRILRCLGNCFNSKLRDILSKGPKYRKHRSFTWKQNSKLILDSIEEYARRWAKKEDVEVGTLSEWVKSVMSLVNRRVSVLSRTMSRRHKSVFDDQDVAAELAEIHEKFVVVPADKASNNIVLQNTLYKLLNGRAWYEYQDRKPYI